TEGDSDVIVTTKEGMSIRFSEDDVRAMGRAARGVRAITLDDGDEAVNVAAVAAEVVDAAQESDESGPALLTVCENGFGKRTPITEYRRQSRGGKGVIDIKTQERNGPVVGSCVVESRDEMMLITTGGKVIRIEVKGISQIGRNTMGVNLVSLDEGESVAAIARLADKSESDEEPAGNGAGAAPDDDPDSDSE
ncbi:MAG TPA: DNA gyrase C-terminal beta-propeller domain-containing protein, partial [Oligoflexia bacterium]|nr:DNA gyrase C-terminal beta-propeller domain-containing protein [Oligoflexia bacterium]